MSPSSPPAVGRCAYGTVLAALALPIALALAACGQEIQPERQSAPAPIDYDGPLAALAARDSFSGTVLVGRPDTVFEASYRAGGAPETMYTDTELRYPLGEVGQLLLRAAYFRFADQGRLQLNASVAEYLPDLPEARTINYRMLLDHRAGLPPQLPPGARGPGDLALVSVPGAEVHYSPLGYHLLADALGRILGTDAATVIRTAVTEPAGMRNTGVLDPAAPVGKLAVGHTPAADGFARVPFSAWAPRFAARDARGPLRGLPEYYATAGDLYYLAQWMPASAYLEGRLAQAGARPGYRSGLLAEIAPPHATIVLSNLGSVDVERVQELLEAKE